MLFLSILYEKDYIMKKLIVPNKYDGKKLSKFILDSFPHLSPNMLYKALRQKDIKINGTRINKDCTIYVGNEILVYITDNFLCPSINLDIVFEDENILIINKPSNIEVTGNDSSKVYIYGDYNSAVKGGCMDCDSLGSYLTELDNVFSSEDIDRYAISNYDSIKDKLDTYTYTFENKDGHFVLSDYSVKHSR